MKNVLVIDGQGGKLGKQIIESIRAEMPDIDLIAVGTNSIATSSMLKGGVSAAATGENAICVNAARADIIIGPIGIVITNSMLGEITQAMATAISTSNAIKILIPIGRCHNLIAGTSSLTTSELIADAVSLLKSQL